MKELEQIHKDKVEISTQATVPVKSETKITTVSIQPGHTIFKINLENLLVSKLQDDDYEKYIDFKTGKKTKVIVKQKHLYCAALNKKNAMKKFGKMMHSMGVTLKSESRPELNPVE